MAPHSNSLSDEKDVEAKASHLDTVTYNGISAEDLEFVANFPEEKKKKVLAKIDVCAISRISKFILTFVVATHAYAGYSLPRHLHRQSEYRKCKD